MAGKKTVLPAVPVYHLYGERDSELAPDLVHCESIASRSRLHNWEIQPHRHHGLFQMLWLARGKARVELDGRPADLSGGQVLLLPQHCVHGFRFSEDADGEVITLAYAFFQRLQPDLGPALQAMSTPVVYTPRAGADRRQIEAAFQSTHEAYAGHHAYRSLLIEAQLVSLLVRLLRLLPVQEDDLPLARGREHLTRFSQLVETNYAAQHPLEFYSASLGISTAHLNALCRQLTGHSALSLVHTRIALEARRYLVYTSMPVKDVSDVLGFSDPAYFTRFFKRQTGIAPISFRARARQA
jgi:AraC family transcriptional activator of pobA